MNMVGVVLVYELDIMLDFLLRGWQVKYSHLFEKEVFLSPVAPWYDRNHMSVCLSVHLDALLVLYSPKN